MKRTVIATSVAAWIALAASQGFLVTQNASQRARIAELEHDNAVAFRLCGVVMCVPCNKGESGAQCQARMGDRYEVIYYPAADVNIAELRAEVTP